MWSAIKAARWYVLLTIVLFLTFLIVYFPAQFAWSLAEERVGRMPVRVLSVSGTVWDGQGVIRYQSHEVGVTWTLNGWSLLSLQPELALNASMGSQAELSTKVSVSEQLIEVNDLTGELSVPLINPYLKAHRASGEGQVKLYGLNVSFDLEQKQILEADGRLLWQEAKATYPGPKGLDTVTLPDIAGRLQKDDKGATLNVMSGEDGSSLASVFMMNNGWGGVKVRKRSVDLVGQTWVGSQQPDDVIFQVREKLW